MDLGDGFFLAGWGESGGDWHNTEAGDAAPTEADLYDSDLVIGFTDEHGVTTYWTILDGVDGWDGLDDAIADAEDRYGLAAG